MLPDMVESTSLAGSSGPGYNESTLDEPIWRTIYRDVVTIGRNLRSVLIPIKWGEFSNRDHALRNWDLWGPLLFMLMLATTLSWGEQSASQVFSLVFAECGLGAIVLTVNVILLGGDIVFFQSLCLLGYCLFPMCMAAIVCAATANKIARTLSLLLGLVWASCATVPFVGGAVNEK
uniref:Protein YIP n=1 Tax=Dunaliella tertiolecta TaxID=3047 RepID=A0A7S3VLA5_DUNTE